MAYWDNLPGKLAYTEDNVRGALWAREDEENAAQKTKKELDDLASDRLE